MFNFYGSIVARTSLGLSKFGNTARSLTLSLFFYYVLTESEVITGKSQTEALMHIKRLDNFISVKYSYY